MNQIFAEQFWQFINNRPLGTLTKRELELNIVEASINASIIQANPHAVARLFHVSIAKAHSYLNDIALRQEEMNNQEALVCLKALLNTVEIKTELNFLVIPINNARLRIWLEREMAFLSLNTGESIRRDLIKISPFSLLKLLKGSRQIISPYEALKKLKSDYKNDKWYKEALLYWKKETTWDIASRDILTNLISVNISSGLDLFKIAICQMF